jgi:hypothetical protein
MTQISQFASVLRRELREINRGAWTCVTAFSILFLNGCGGISDGISKPTLSVQFMTGDTALVNQKVSLGMLSLNGAGCLDERAMNTDTDGVAAATFNFRWASAFFIIPPIGNIPQRPERPQYLVSWSGYKVRISKDTPGAVYIWNKGSWLTKATISFPPH